jgi:hypothetical protein
LRQLIADLEIAMRRKTLTSGSVLKAVVTSLLDLPASYGTATSGVRNPRVMALCAALAGAAEADLQHGSDVLYFHTAFLDGLSAIPSHFNASSRETLSRIRLQPCR